MPPLAALTLCARGLDTRRRPAPFWTLSRGQLLDPFLMKDMDRAAARVRRALAAGNTSRSTATTTWTASPPPACSPTSSAGRGDGDPLYPRPDGGGLRPQPGGGGRPPGPGVGLIVTVDCGITAVEEAACAASLGVELVITDHHECKAALPAAAAVVDPAGPTAPIPSSAWPGWGWPSSWCWPWAARPGGTSCWSATPIWRPSARWPMS
ncbi:hypothetical protein M5E87_03885 [Flavonifractor plautii]|nr:hypothetical protein M5E87_03885 [Flavonifractor plautii]